MSLRVHRVLIANRGEIAVRLARGVREFGGIPLGVYSEADRQALHRTVMDDSVLVGPAPAAESYLAIDRILDAARQMNADAVHPGYGFLSEREAFARAVRDAGLTFVGPPPEAIAAMGDKTEAKHRARAHDVPVVPGYDEADVSPERLREEAARIGTPLLIKASAGGGGRGMRVVTDLATFDESLGAAKREAAAAFGDDRVLLERYLRRPRHIEFQILADAHGNMVHFGERECSIQRRHQKIVEEAPSVALSPELRAVMGEAALRAARSAGYENAGTVEFLLDEDGAFYFLEMNARLQVEHPVTELAYGVDLVQWQLRIASGERLTLEQSELRPRQWAIEVRINAEDPRTGYLPSSGTIERYVPPQRPFTRLDSGVAAGSRVSIYYDSMLAKLIAYGFDRPAALRELGDALRSFEIDGVGTNLPLLRRIVADPAFQIGETTTGFLGERAAWLEPEAEAQAEPQGAVLLGFAKLLLDGRAWRIAATGVPLALQGEARTWRVTASRTGWEADMSAWLLRGDLDVAISIGGAGEQVTVDCELGRFGGQVRVTTPAGGSGDAEGARRALDVVVEFEGVTYRLAVPPPPALGAERARGTAGAHGTIAAPMPGKILRVAVKAGDPVAERDLLIVLEAMKMEHRIESPRAGTVRSVAVEPGALVAAGTPLVEWE